MTDDFTPDAIILNNDFTVGPASILTGINQPIYPLIQLGWSSRLKSQHFIFVEQVNTHFANYFGIDPWLITPYFSAYDRLDFLSKTPNETLIAKADQLLTLTAAKYKEYGINQAPYLVIKADQGTFGMAIMMIEHADELTSLNRKQCKNMASLKGGRAVTQVIFQEGIPSSEYIDTQITAEPVIYHIGKNCVGGFYRANTNKGAQGNLNAPGMYFSPLSLNTSTLSAQSYTYTVVSRLATLAAAHEIASLQGA